MNDTDDHVLAGTKRLLETAFTYQRTKKQMVPPHGVHFYADKRAVMVPMGEVKGKVAVFETLARTVQHAGLVGTVYVSHSDPGAELHPCYAASINLPDRGLTLILKYKETPEGLVGEDIATVEDEIVPGNLAPTTVN